LKIYKKEVLILKIINEYSFKEGLTKKELEYAGFTNFSQSFYFYTRTLISGVSLKISIPVNENGDLCLDQSDIIVEDDIFMQPYLLFYDAINSKYGVRLNGSARKLIDEYNKKMDVLEQKGVLVKIKDMVLEFESIFKAKKQEKNIIDFNDIEHYALKILENDQVAEGYKQKFKFIFVDEYQDSNIIQETMINRIARANNVFMVGDVKQSIYKFRLAEPEIFEQKYSDYKAGKIPTSKVIDLNANFRSKGNVIRTVNEQFESIMKGYDEDAALYKGVVYEGPMDHQSELHIAFTGADDIEDVEIKELKTAEMEALAAVSVIKENVEKVDKTV